jgi:hypothetical protein
MVTPILFFCSFIFRIVHFKNVLSLYVSNIKALQFEKLLIQRFNTKNIWRTQNNS